MNNNMTQHLVKPSCNTIAVDVFAVAHFMYHSALKKKRREGEEPKLEQSVLANKKDDGTIYPRMAYLMIEFFEKLASLGKPTYLLFDNATSKTTARKFISEKYKSSRTHKSNVFYKTVDFVQLYASKCMTPNTYVVRVPTREADDLIKSLVLYSEEGKIPTGKIVAIANDSDWYAYLHRDNFEMIWFGDDEPYTEESFVNEYRFPPTLKSVAVYKALMGDRSDDIEPVLSKRDISMEDLEFLVMTYGKGELAETLPVAIGLDENLTAKVKTKLREGRDQYRMNLKLTDYMHTGYERLMRYTTQSTNNKRLRNALMKAIGAVADDTAPVKGFSFGGVSVNV